MKAARIYISAVIVVGALIGAFTIMHWSPQSLSRLGVFLGLFSGAALLKVRVPGVTGTYSPVFFFVLLGSFSLSMAEVTCASALAGIIQCTVCVQRRPSLFQIAFNAANMTISTASAFVIIHRQLPALDAQPVIVLLILGVSIYYVVNTALVSVVLSLVESGSLVDVWRHWCLGSLPFYLVGALIAGLTVSAEPQLSLESLLLVCPAVVLVSVFYRFRLKMSRTA